MLTIAKLRTSSVDYYLSSVARGIEDYYAGHGEAPGRWLGDGVEHLGLDGDVDGHQLRNVLAGHLPGLDEPVGGGRANRTPGWDLTWSAPKSVSILYGLSDADTSRAVVAAHDAAVAEGMKYLDRWALVSRRRVDGDIVGVEGTHMVAAGFRHRTSRAMDPQLHTHALVANAVQRADGTWGAIDSRVLFRHAKTAGFVYQAVLRSELTQRLGIQWGPITKGVAEARIVPAELRALFSTRRQEIEAELDARGASSMTASRVAALRTRTAKGDAAGTDVLREQWRTKAHDAHLTLPTIRTEPAAPQPETVSLVTRRQRRVVNDDLMSATGLTKDRASFHRADVVRAWCEHLDPHTIGVNADVVDDLAATTIADSRMVTLGNGNPLDGPAEPRRWSTTELVQLEQRIINTVTTGRHTNTARIDSDTVARTINAARTLTGEQADMVRSLTTDGHRIDAVIGIAGAGKTYALGVAHQLWADHNHPVIGVAFAGKAARQLQRDAGIASSTIDRLLTELDRPGHPGLPERAVVVVDEAAMVPTRKLAELLGHCREDTKVVLVGDHHQLPEIGAGGIMASLANRLTDTPTLNENRRQHDHGERHALNELRYGDIIAGIGWYRANDRIAHFDDMNTARHALIDTWWNDTHGQPRDHLLMAERRSDVDHLNRLARHRYQQAGRLGTDTITIGDTDLATGDRVMFTRNDYDIGVRNGDRGTITHLDTHARSAVVRVDGLTDHTDQPHDVTVTADYLDHHHLQWGYAATVHKNQGSTCDHGYLLASDALYRELGYVALSRGRIDNRIWLVNDLDPNPDDPEPHGPPHPEPPKVDPLIRSLERSHAQQLAIDEAHELQPDLEPADNELAMN